jgi:hypothetical protein
MLQEQFQKQHLFGRKSPKKSNCTIARTVSKNSNYISGTVLNNINYDARTAFLYSNHISEAVFNNSNY